MNNNLNNNELEEELRKLIMILQERKNKAVSFFESILQELNTNSQNDALNKLKTSFSITQYANFTKEEEDILEKIVREAGKCK